MNRSASFAAAACLSVVCGATAAAVQLPKLNIDPAQITVSGLSSGGFMANQLGYAFSSTFKGVGVFAAGRTCARATATTRHACTTRP